MNIDELDYEEVLLYLRKPIFHGHNFSRNACKWAIYNHFRSITTVEEADLVVDRIIKLDNSIVKFEI